MLPLSDAQIAPTTGRAKDLGRPRRLGAGGLCLLLLLLLTATAAAAQDPHPWIGQEHRIEEVLRLGTVLSKEEIGRGITNPYRVVLEHDGERLRGVWKPLDKRLHGDKESYASEIAAYRLSRALGLDMVPPTVLRRVGRQMGSLQLWVEDVRPYEDVMVEGSVAESRWPQQVARMRFFDHLIDNPDRNAGNFLVDVERGRVYLIDHSRALNFAGRGRQSDSSAPYYLDLYLAERLGDLSDGDLFALLGDVLSKRDVRGVIRLRDQLIDHVEGVEERLGEAAFFVADGQISEPR